MNVRKIMTVTISVYESDVGIVGSVIPCPEIADLEMMKWREGLLAAHADFTGYLSEKKIINEDAD